MIQSAYLCRCKNECKLSNSYVVLGDIAGQP